MYVVLLINSDDEDDNVITQVVGPFDSAAQAHTWAVKFSERELIEPELWEIRQLSLPDLASGYATVAEED